MLPASPPGRASAATKALRLQGVLAFAMIAMFGLVAYRFPEAPGQPRFASADATTDPVTTGSVETRLRPTIDAEQPWPSDDIGPAGGCATSP